MRPVNWDHNLKLLQPLLQVIKNCPDLEKQLIQPTHHFDPGVSHVYANVGTHRLYKSAIKKRHIAFNIALIQCSFHVLLSNVKCSSA